MRCMCVSSVDRWALCVSVWSPAHRRSGWGRGAALTTALMENTWPDSWLPADIRSQVNTRMLSSPRTHQQCSSQCHVHTTSVFINECTAKETTSTTKCETFILKDVHESCWHFCQMQCLRKTHWVSAVRCYTVFVPHSSIAHAVYHFTKAQKLRACNVWNNSTVLINHILYC